MQYNFYGAGLVCDLPKKYEGLGFGLGLGLGLGLRSGLGFGSYGWLQLITS